MSSKYSKGKSRLIENDELDLEYSQMQNDVEQEYAQFPNGAHADQSGQNAATSGTQSADLEQQTPTIVQINYSTEKSWRKEMGESLGAVFRPGGADNYLPWSIINTLFCGVVIGLIAMVFSIKSAMHNDSGKRALAQRYSYIAYVLNIFATMVGTVTFITLYILYVTTDLLDKGANQITWFPQVPVS